MYNHIKLRYASRRGDSVILTLTNRLTDEFYEDVLDLCIIYYLEETKVKYSSFERVKLVMSNGMYEDYYEVTLE